MKTVRYLLIWALSAVTGNVLGDELHVDDFSIEPGETKEISVELNNPDHSYTLLEFKLTLPEGLGIARDEDGDFLIATSDRITRVHTLDMEETGVGEYKFLIYSGSGVATIKGNAGELFKITVVAAETASGRNLKGRFHSQLFVDADNVGTEPADNYFNVDIGSSILGDVNKDQSITIADVTALVNILSGNGNMEYDHIASDVDGKDGITEEDVTALVNMILNQ